MGRIGSAFGRDVVTIHLVLSDRTRGLVGRVDQDPHIGYVTKKTYEDFHRDAVEDVAAFLAGRPLRVLEP